MNQRLSTGSVLVEAIPKPKPIKPAPAKTTGTWKTGYGIKGFPTPKTPPKAVSKPCSGKHPESGISYWEHTLKNYAEPIKAAYEARGVTAAWAAGIKIFMASCCKRTGKNAFAGQSFNCKGKKLTPKGS